MTHSFHLSRQTSEWFCRMVLFFHSLLQPDIKEDNDVAASHKNENEQVMGTSAMYVMLKGNL